MMITKKIISKSMIVAAACIIGLASCRTTEESGKIYQLPDYTIDDVRNEEIKRIESLSEKDSVQAYWRASLLKDEKTIDVMASKVVADFDKAVEEKQWIKAKRLYAALKNLNYKQLNSLSYSEEKLTDLAYSTVNSFAPANGRQVKVPQLITGTVTVWVDKGIKVENGMGYADRVIGSGFFVSKDGYIVTNHHVIADLVNPKYEGFARLYVKLAEDTETRIPAKVVGWDSVMDLAVLKAEVDAPYVFSLGSSKNLEVGDKIFCIGSPIGLERTITSGIVSASDRMLFSAGPVMQIDAAVNSGNSGGPCVDQAGNVQAVVFAGMLQYSGLNFAIPVEYLKSELAVLVDGGKYEHSWMEAYGRTKKVAGKELGVELNYVMPGGNAFRTGLKAGDLITSIDGVAIRNLEDLQKKMMGITAQSVINVKYLRDEDQDEKSVMVYVSSRPLNPGYEFYKNDIIPGSFIPIYGMKLNTLTEGRRKYQIESVIKGSIADESGFSDSDPIEIKSITFNNDNTGIYCEIYAKNRKKGYLDISMGITAPLDSPYYF